MIRTLKVEVYYTQNSNNINFLDPLGEKDAVFTIDYSCLRLNVGMASSLIQEEFKNISNIEGNQTGKYTYELYMK